MSTSPGPVGRYVDHVIDGAVPNAGATLPIPRRDRPKDLLNTIAQIIAAPGVVNIDLDSARNTVVRASGEFGICLPCLQGDHDQCRKPCSCRSKWHQ